MQKKYEFEAVINKTERIDASYIEFPFDVEKEFGVKGQVKVKATFDGIEYRGSLAKMGHKCHILGITKEIRTKIGKTFGDTVSVILQKDEELRSVELPDDFRILLDKNKKAKENFEKLSFTNKKEMIRSIESAKKMETREKRIKDYFEKLSK